MAAKTKINRRNTVKKRGGRPTVFKPEYCEMARKMCLLGAKDKQIADCLDISEKTFYLWKAKYPKFLQAIKDGKENADSVIANSLYHRARGYSHPEVHVSNYQGEITQTKLIKHYPPDATSMIFWLKNRQPENWRDQHDLKHSGNVSIGEILELP